MPSFPTSCTLLSASFLMLLCRWDKQNHSYARCESGTPSVTNDDLFSNFLYSIMGVFFDVAVWVRSAKPQQRGVRIWNTRFNERRTLLHVLVLYYQRLFWSYCVSERRKTGAKREGNLEPPVQRTMPSFPRFGTLLSMSSLLLLCEDLHVDKIINGDLSSSGRFFATCG